MPCYSQMLAYPTPGKTKNGKTPYKFVGKAANLYTRYGSITGALLLPCKQCIGCRLEKSRQWATRLMHETKFHSGSIFLTLTYDESNLPKNGSLVKSHLRTFFKDLRARNSYYGKNKIKYFACGEYGDTTGRPHYHAGLFGDLSIYDDAAIEEEPSRSGDRQFTHPDITATWPHGLHRFSEFNFETAAYVARYVLKKISGPASQAHYGNRIPEFQSSSNGLGKGHVETWLDDIYPSDHVVIPGRGAFMPPPYYDRLLEKRDPGLYQQVKLAREAAKEKMNVSEWNASISERHREGEVRTLVTEQTLIRGLL